MAYERIDWENEPSVDTPLNEDNLNHMDEAISNLDSDVAGKMDANNPTGTGAVSVNRLSGSVVGYKSVAMGDDCSATMANGVAMGSRAVASGVSAIAMGQGSVARANYSHSFGRIGVAEGEDSVVFGYATNAKSDNQFVEGKYNEVDTDGTYAHIVGGGTGEDDRRNIQTLDWEGNEAIAGDYTNGNGETLHGIYEALPVDSASGNPAVITDAFGSACKSLKLTIEPIQSGSGTPSPQNVRPISGRTQSVVTRTGKNLLQMTLAGIKALNTTGTWSDNVYAVNGMTFTINTDNDGNITSIGLNGTATAQTIFQLGQSPLSGSYTLNGCPTGGNYNSGYSMYITGIYVVDEGAGVDFSLSGTSYMTSILVRSGAAASSATFYPMIRLSSESNATYEPYNSETITRTYGTTIYGGTDNVTGDGATSTYALVDLGSLTWEKSSSGTIWFRATLTGLNANWGDIIPAKCSQYMSSSGARVYVGSDDNAVGGTTNLVYIYDSSKTSLTAEQFKTAMDGVQLAYKVSSPTTIPLTAQNSTLLHGDNVLTTDADSIDVEYSADIALYIDKKIAERISQGNRSLSKGGSSEPEEETKEIKKEEIKEEEPKEETKEEEIKEEIKEVKEEK